MAKKRMFDSSVLDTDAFLSMPLSTQALYFHLNLRADDDGFVGNPRRIQAYIGASEDDLKLLIAKRFLLSFEDGVVVIKHWKMHNLIRKERYQPTAYQEDAMMLGVKRNKSYTLDPDKGAPLVSQVDVTQMSPKCHPNVTQMSPQYRLGKDRVGKDRLEEVRLGKVRSGKSRSDKNSLDISAQSSAEPSQQNPPIVTIQLNTGQEYPIYQTDIDQYKALYPSVDIEQQLRSMKAWSLSNPTKRKTIKGIKRFINSWLAREQDKPHPQQTGGNRYADKLKEVANWNIG